MKKIICLVLTTALLCIAMTSCGEKKPKGKYVLEMFGTDLITEEFTGGNKVEHTNSLEAGSKKGTYTMKDDVISIVYEDGGTNTYNYDSEADTLDSAGLIFKKK